MEDNSRRAGHIPVITQTAFPTEEVRRPTSLPVTNYNNTVENVIEIRKPTIDEMKNIFLVLLRDNDVIEEIRKRL